MAPLRRLLRALELLVRHPRDTLGEISELPLAMREHVRRRHGVDRGLPVLDLLELLPGGRAVVEPFAFLEGGCLPTDLALLRALAQRARARGRCRYLEIGTWRGESVANVAAVADECITFYLPGYGDAPAGSVRDNEVQCYFSRGLANVKHIARDSLTFDFSTLGEPFDLIFIDGDHRYEAVLSDTRNAFPLLRNEHSVIVWHDYGLTPETVRWTVLAAMLDGVPAGLARHLYQVSNTLSAIYVRGDFDTSVGRYPQRPDKAFSVELSCKPI